MLNAFNNVTAAQISSKYIIIIQQQQRRYCNILLCELYLYYIIILTRYLNTRACVNIIYILKTDR